MFNTDFPYFIVILFNLLILLIYLINKLWSTLDSFQREKEKKHTLI